MLTPTLQMETRHSQLGGNKGVNLQLGAESILWELGQNRRGRLPQGDVSEAQVSHLVLIVAVGVDDVDVGPGVGDVTCRAAQVNQKLLYWLDSGAGLAGQVLSVRILAAVSRAGRFITFF